jgi:hypothetical protein
VTSHLHGHVLGNAGAHEVVHGGPPRYRISLQSNCSKSRLNAAVVAAAMDVGVSATDQLARRFPDVALQLLEHVNQVLIHFDSHATEDV